MCDWSRPSSGHNQTVLCGLMDGSVRSVTPSLTAITWQNAINPQDGNVLGSDW